MSASVPINDSEALHQEIAELRARLGEAEDTLAAICNGDVDGLMVGNDLYTLDSANIASNKLRKDVLAQMEEAVLGFDNEGHVIFMNPAAERQYRQEASSALGHLRDVLYREEQSDGLPASGLPQAGSGDVRRFQAGHVLRDGASIHVECTVSQLHDVEGNIIGSLNVIRDISAQYQIHLALQSSHARYKELLTSMGEGFLVIDENFRILEINTEGLRIDRRSEAEIVGRLPWEVWPDSKGSVIEVIYRKIMQAGVPETFRYCYFGNGFEQWLEIKAYRVTGGLASFFRDVTAMVNADIALRHSEQRFRAAIAAIGVLWTNNEHGMMKGEQPGWTKLTGQSFDEYQGYGWANALHPDDAQPTIDGWQLALAEQRTFEFEHRVRRYDGVWRRFSVCAVPLLTVEGKLREWVGVHIDITDVAEANEALRLADQRKDEFLATLAHELRNPLAPIRNALQIMQLTPDPAVHGNARSIIERQMQQMVHLVDDLLDVSRISQGKVELRRQSIDVASVVQAAIETSRPLIDGGRHELTVRSPAPRSLMIDGDITRLTQIIANLLNNAAKYTPPGGSIIVSVEGEGGDAVISVQDSGVGIPPHMLPRVFDLFAQVDRTLERSQGGLGIGLALVKKLVEMHGGSVAVFSKGSGQGSRFVVRIPRAKSLSMPAMQAETQKLNAPSLESNDECRVLIVDDNIDSAESLMQILNMLGYKTWIAHDGPAALQLATQCQPHIAILDIGLPGMNGHDLGHELRQYDWGKSMLMIALSGWGQEADRRKSKDVGFDHHYVKPVDIEALTMLISKKKNSRGR